MKQFLTCTVIGMLIIFGMVAFGIGMHSVFGDNAGKAFLGMIVLIFGSAFLGVVARDIFSGTRWMKKINDWAGK